jgi:hypothetical protein
MFFAVAAHLTPGSTIDITVCDTDRTASASRFLPQKNATATLCWSCLGWSRREGWPAAIVSAGSRDLGAGDRRVRLVESL